MSTPDAERREQSIAEHVRGLSEESAGLVREQAQLIREDLIDELKRLGLGGVMLGGAGLLGLGAFGALTAGLVSAFGAGKRGALTVTVMYGAPRECARPADGTWTEIAALPLTGLRKRQPVLAGVASLEE